MRLQKIKSLIILTFITAMLLSACNVIDLGNVNAAQSDNTVSIGTAKNADLVLGQARFYGNVAELDGEKIRVDNVVFRTDANSVVDAGLSIGDPVRVDAILLPDQSRYAVVINLQPQSESASSNSDLEYKLYGQVDGMGSESWVISGEVIYVDSSTRIDNGIALRDLVEVEGYVVNGRLLAKEINLEDSLPGYPVETPETTATVVSTPGSQPTPMATSTTSLPSGNEIEFYGNLESKNGSTWMIAGKTLTILAQTEIKGTLLIGDMVKVHAWRQADGSLLAREIEKSGDSHDSDSSDDHKIKGIITSMNGSQWMVAGIVVLIDSFTEFDHDLKVGDTVEIEGFWQSDGSLLAKEIDREDIGSDSSNDDDNDDSNNDNNDDSYDDNDDNDDDQSNDDDYDDDHDDKDDDHEDDDEGKI